MCSEFRVMVIDLWNTKFITEHSAIYILKYVVSFLEEASTLWSISRFQLLVSASS
jgi:hypothetical protein